VVRGLLIGESSAVDKASIPTFFFVIVTTITVNIF